MTWTAPTVSRSEPEEAVGERAMLEAWLDYHRLTLLAKCAGLTAEQLRRRSVPPSTMSLHGLVRHMADVERSWFRRRAAGLSLDYLYCSDDDPDGDFDNVDSADAEKDFATFDEEVSLARESVADRSLDATFIHARTGQELSVRWVYVHMIEEYARHNGHADLLRECIDGQVGD